MDGFALGLFLVAAFIGGFSSGLAGFAMGFVVSGIWLHILTPVQTTTLIVGYGLLTQGYGVWKLRHALAWKALGPFIIGGTIGVPIGTTLLTYVDPTYLRSAVGLLLVVYGTYALTQPMLKPAPDKTSADAAVGLVNGVLAGLTGLPGFVITIWCQLRGWTKDLQRAVFQPVMLAAIIINVISLSFAGAFTSDIVKLYLLGLRRHRVPQADATAFVGVRPGADRSARMAHRAIRQRVAAFVSDGTSNFARGCPLQGRALDRSARGFDFSEGQRRSHSNASAWLLDRCDCNSGSGTADRHALCDRMNEEVVKYGTVADRAVLTQLGIRS
jgi:uncharacterized membrane protein YfcA